MTTQEKMQIAMDAMSVEFQKFAGDDCDHFVLLNVKGIKIQMSSTVPHDILMGLFRDIIAADDMRKGERN